METKHETENSKLEIHNSGFSIHNYAGCWCLLSSGSWLLLCPSPAKRNHRASGQSSARIPVLLHQIRVEFLHKEFQRRGVLHWHWHSQRLGRRRLDRKLSESYCCQSERQHAGRHLHESGCHRPKHFCGANLHDGDVCLRRQLYRPHRRGYQHIQSDNSYASSFGTADQPGWDWH